MKKFIDKLKDDPKKLIMAVVVIGVLIAVTAVCI